MLTELEFLTFILLKFLPISPHQENARTWGKKNPFYLPILDTKDIGQCFGVKDHPTKMGSNLVVLWLFVLTTRGKWVPNKYTYEIDQDSPFGLLATNLFFPRIDIVSKQECRRWIGCPLFTKDWNRRKPFKPIYIQTTWIPAFLVHLSWTWRGAFRFVHKVGIHGEASYCTSPLWSILPVLPCNMTL